MHIDMGNAESIWLSLTILNNIEMNGAEERAAFGWNTL